jgi:hypothetical protein
LQSAAIWKHVALAKSDLQAVGCSIVALAGRVEMIRVLRRLSVPASESHLGMALALAAVTMGLMLWAILWQSNIILYQRDVIRWIWNSHMGG